MTLQYAFESIRIARHREGTAPIRDYREVIRERATDGWEFVQAISFEHDVTPRLDLVFVRKDGSK